MKKDALVALLFVAALGVGALAVPPLHPVPVVHDPLLERALLEARANCQAARTLGMEGCPRVLLRTEDLETALRTCVGFQRDTEEHVRLLLVSRLIGDVARACAADDVPRRLAEERLTEEDFRFLLAAVHWRLAREAGLIVSVHPEDFDAKRLRQFRGLGFEAGIRSLFD